MSTARSNGIQRNSKPAARQHGKGKLFGAHQQIIMPHAMKEERHLCFARVLLGAIPADQRHMRCALHMEAETREGSSCKKPKYQDEVHYG